MTVSAKPGPDAIRRARSEHEKMRERDLAAQLGISEGDLVAAHCGEGVTRIHPQVNDVLAGLAPLGEVMALTRNESAVHEKIGVYDKVVPGERVAMMLGADIDLRIIPSEWRHGFAVERRDGDSVKRSLQFFNAAGNAVHKVHLRPASDVAAYESLVASLVSDDQSPTIESVVPEIARLPEGTPGGAEELRERWSRMTDVHQFFGMLRKLNLSRRDAVGMVGDDYAWRLDGDALSAMFHRAVQEAIPIMCYVGNQGCIQIHSGPIFTVKPMGPWINVMDPTFHLHLRLDHVSELWAVRKPTSDGHVTSLEAYDSAGEMIIQFFGKRHEGEGELGAWRMIAEGLPRVAASTAA